MKVVAFLFFLIIFVTPAQADQCYVTVENTGGYSDEEISALAVPLISQYVVPVAYIPIEGISTKACQLKVYILENRENISVTLTGKGINAYGDSFFRGMKGVKQAILRAIINAKPGMKASICNSYRTSLATDCMTAKEFAPDTLSATGHLFADRFDNDEWGWRIWKNGKHYDSYFKNGGYFLRTKNEKCSWEKISLPVDLPHSFTISIKTRWLGGKDNQAFGLAIGKNSQNYYHFGLSGNGRAVIWLVLNGDHQPDPLAWNRNQGINKHGINYQTIEYKNGRIEYRINDRYIKRISNQIEIDPDIKIGVRVCRQQSVLFDDLIIKSN